MVRRSCEPILILVRQRALIDYSLLGLLHRGTEKLLEYKTYLQGLPYFDRLDYGIIFTPLLY